MSVTNQKTIKHNYAYGSSTKVNAHLPRFNFKPTAYKQTFIEKANLTHWMNVATNYPYKVTTTPTHTKYSSIVSQLHLQETIDQCLSHYTNITKNPGNVNIIHKMKLSFPTNTRVLFMGDFHSDMHSLLSNLNYLLLKNILSEDLKLKSGFKLIFLGDLVDRNYYGMECLYFAFQLKLHNPNDVYILNGNHEDPDTYTRYNFKNEIKSNINVLSYRQRLRKVLHLLPIVLLFKFANMSGYYYCCHGGFSNDTNAMNFKNNGSSVSRKMKNTYGQNWSDFTCTQSGVTLSSRGPGIATFGTKATQDYMNKHNINAVFRGHQDMYSLTFLTREVTQPLNYDTYEKRPLSDDLVDVWREGFISNTNNGLIHKTKTIPSDSRQNTKHYMLTFPINKPNNTSSKFSNEFLPVFTTSSASAKSDFTHTCILELYNVLPNNKSKPKLNRQNAFKSRRFLNNTKMTSEIAQVNPLFMKTRQRSSAVNLGKTRQRSSAVNLGKNYKL